MQKVLEVKNITKIYKIYKSNFDRLKELFINKIYHKEFISNKNITFDLLKGETLGIIGVNGAGKSTILKIIAGITQPTSGEVLKHGRVTALLELGTGFNLELSGYDNIFLNGTLIGMTNEECKDRLDDIIAFSELGDYIHEPIMSYSTGMQMRLAFSIALYSEPQIFIVDEALSVGDAHFAAKCTQALTKRKEKDMSIIYVSHDLNSLKLLCDRVILLNHGEIVEEGKPENVINSYNYLISLLNENAELIQLKDPSISSYGTLDIEIMNVTIKGEQSASNLITSGENVIIEIDIFARKYFSNMTVGIMIRDRFGQDIFGTNTYHHKKVLEFQKDCQYRCLFRMPLNIGIGKYSITAAIHSESTHHHECSHWLDHAEVFEVAGVHGALFGGICRLEPKISFEKIVV